MSFFGGSTGNIGNTTDQAQNENPILQFDRTQNAITLNPMDLMRERLNSQSSGLTISTEIQRRKNSSASEKWNIRPEERIDAESLRSSSLAASVRETSKFHSGLDEDIAGRADQLAGLTARTDFVCELLLSPFLYFLLLIYAIKRVVDPLLVKSGINTKLDLFNDDQALLPENAVGYYGYGKFLFHNFINDRFLYYTTLYVPITFWGMYMFYDLDFVGPIVRNSQANMDCYYNPGDNSNYSSCDTAALVTQFIGVTRVVSFRNAILSILLFILFILDFLQRDDVKLMLKERGCIISGLYDTSYTSCLPMSDLLASMKTREKILIFRGRTDQLVVMSMVENSVVYRDMLFINTLMRERIKDVRLIQFTPKMNVVKDQIVE